MRLDTSALLSLTLAWLPSFLGALPIFSREALNTALVQSKERALKENDGHFQNNSEEDEPLL